MLLWEMLSLSPDTVSSKPTNAETSHHRTRRLPYDKRCGALTKSGARCHGRIREGGEFCLFHDPRTIALRRRAMVNPQQARRRRLSHLPDGYLRKLSNLAAVGSAMDRLYREVRLGVITPEMGRVMFNILTRLMDSGLVSSGRAPQRSKAAKARPKLHEQLTRGERMAWNRAVEGAVKLAAPGEQAAKVVLQAAS